MQSAIVVVLATVLLCHRLSVEGLVPYGILISPNTSNTSTEKNAARRPTESREIVYPQKLGEIVHGSSSAHSILS